MAFKHEAQRPMRNLLTRLPLLPLTARKEIDFEAAEPSLLVALLDDAETTMNTIHEGIGAIGHLLAHSAVVIDDGTVAADSIESRDFCSRKSATWPQAAWCSQPGADVRLPTTNQRDQSRSGVLERRVGD